MCWSALTDLVSRYCHAIAFHWRRRHIHAVGSYTSCEAEFLPASLALIEQPVSPTARITAGLLMLLVAAGVTWAVQAHVDIVVSARGKVIPSGRTKTIASVDVASVRAIHVVEGQSVRAGQLLVELDAGVFEADQRRAEVDVDAARLEIARSQALITAIDKSRPPVLSIPERITQEQYQEARAQLIGQYLDLQAKLAQIDGDIARYSRALPLVQERATNYEQLAKTRDVPSSAWSERLQAAIDLEGQLNQAKNARLSLIAQTRRQALDTLTSARRVVNSATQDAARAFSHARLLTLRAPVDGSVQQLAIHTLGGVVRAAEPLMLIVPKDAQVEVEAYVENKDIGFVREHQTVAVKVQAFDYTKYGTVAGEVISVSRDAIQDETQGLIYQTKIRLTHPDILVNGHPIALLPGMTVDSDIHTGTRRFIEYVLSPLLRHRYESFDER